MGISGASQKLEEASLGMNSLSATGKQRQSISAAGKFAKIWFTSYMYYI